MLNDFKNVLFRDLFKNEITMIDANLFEGLSALTELLVSEFHQETNKMPPCPASLLLHYITHLLILIHSC